MPARTAPIILLMYPGMQLWDKKNRAALRHNARIDQDLAAFSACAPLLERTNMSTPARRSTGWPGRHPRARAGSTRNQVQADPVERWRRSGARRGRLPAVEQADSPTVVTAPFIIQDQAGRPLLQVDAHTLAGGETAPRLRLLNADGSTGITLYSDAAGGVAGVHSPGQQKASLIIRADRQGGILLIRNEAGETEVELPADMPQPAPAPEQRKWWRFW